VKKAFSEGALLLAGMDDEDLPSPVNSNIVKEKVPVQPHRWMWSLMDIGFKVRNNNVDLRQLRVDRSSRRGGSS